MATFPTIPLSEWACPGSAREVQECLTDPNAIQVVCDCGSQSLSIIQAGYATVAKCYVCDRAQVIHEG